jgi:hypothetical protein
MAEDAALVLDGYSELMAELKQMPPRYRRAVTGVFRAQAQQIVRQAAVYAPAGQASGRVTSGRLASDVSIRVGQNFSRSGRWTTCAATAAPHRGSSLPGE